MYQQVQFYGQRLSVVVEAVGMCRAAVRSIVIQHDSTGVTAVKPGFWLSLFNVAFPLLAEHALPIGSVPVEHSCHHSPHHQQRQQAHQNHRHQWIVRWRVHHWNRRQGKMGKKVEAIC